MHILEKIFQELGNAVDKHYPNWVHSSGYSGSDFRFDLTTKFRFYKGSEYYHIPMNGLVHWTNLYSLASIVNNLEMRLYDLHNSEDYDELNFAAALLDLSEQKKEWIKANYFIASFCDGKDLYDKFMWKKYGKEFTGVAIKFSLNTDNIDEWESFLISKVYYELPEKFGSLMNEISSIKQAYDNIPGFDFDLWKLAGFYKIPSFIPEKEIRIAAVYPFKRFEDNYRYTRTELKISKAKNRMVHYIPLKLWRDEGSSYLRSIDLEHSKESYDESFIRSNRPQLKIESISFGNKCGLSETEYYGLRQQIIEWISWRLGYKVNVPLNMTGPNDCS